MSAPPTGVLFYEGRAKPLSTTGAIQPGSYYQFYLSGTTTLTNVYADGTLTTPLSQTPGSGQTTAASDGRLVPIYMNPSIIYRYRLYSATNVLLEDTDPYVIGAATSSSLIPATDDTFSIGTSSFRWQNLYLSKQALIGIPTSGPAILGLQDATRSWYIRTGGAGGGVLDLYDNTSSASRVQISTSGNVTVNAPSSGAAFTATTVETPIGFVLQGPNTGNGWTLEFFDTTASLARGFIGVGPNCISGMAAADIGFISKSGNVQIGRANGSAIATTFGPGGNVTINSPSSGDTLTVAGGGDGIVASSGLIRLNGSTSQINAYASTAFELVQRNNAPVNIYTNGILRAVFGNSGGLTINAPSGAATALQVTGLANLNTVGITSPNTASQSFGISMSAGTNSSDYAINIVAASGSPTYFKVRGDGLVQAIDDGGALQTVGWRDLPQNTVSGGYTLVMADRGKSVVASSGNITIPANGSVAFPIGTTIVLMNTNAASLTIAITTDTLTLAGTTSTGSRTLVQNGMATIVKIGTTSWLISGSGVA